MLRGIPGMVQDTLIPGGQKLSYACSFAFTTTATFEIPGCPGQCNEASGQVAPRSMEAAYM
jgi:hypothetical protein